MKIFAIYYKNIQKDEVLRIATKRLSQVKNFNQQYLLCLETKSFKLQVKKDFCKTFDDNGKTMACRLEDLKKASLLARLTASLRMLMFFFDTTQFPALDVTAKPGQEPVWITYLRVWLMLFNPDDLVEIRRFIALIQ